MTNDLQSILVERIFNPSNEPPPEDVLLTINGKTIGTAGNYVVYSGQAKAGKSTYLGATISSAFLPEYQDSFGIKLKPPAERPIVAYFDTESSQYDFFRQMGRIKLMAQLKSYPLTLDAFSMRQDGPSKIRALIRHYLETTPKCSIVIVDGFLDLCLNYNDEVESRKLVNWFKFITTKYNILLIGVLHLSKGNSETLGHLGSNCDRWAQSTLTIEKNREAKQFVLKSKFLRSSDDFEPIAICNFDGRWTQIPYEFTIQQQYKSSKK